MRSVVVVAMSVLLAGCATEKTVGEMSYPEVKALAASITARCTAEGVRPGTPEMQVCGRHYAAQEVDRRLQDRQDADTARRSFGMAMAAGMSNMGQAYTNAAAVQTYSYRPPVTCTSSVLGRGSSNPVMTTNCQ